MAQLAAHLSPDAGFPFLPDGVGASALASIGTGIGAIPIVFTGDLSDRWRNRFLSVGSGVMLASAAFSLIWPALDWVGHSPDPLLGLGEVAIAFFLGGLFLYGLELWMPVDETPEPDTITHGNDCHLWMFVLAIALHHFPEGLAVGLGIVANQDFSLAIGVGLQNLPEGLMVALACRELGYSLGVSLMMATMSGWLEPLGGAMGGLLANSSISVVPMGMALAAGAMLFVIWQEVLPNLQLKSFTGENSLGLVTGLIVMGLIDHVI